MGERYTEAWRTLSENFGQPHMIVKAHMKKLREIQVRKADETTLIEFVRRLEDARRVLTSMGHKLRESVRQRRCHNLVDAKAP